jgi:DNA-binding IclR family transcriptional regulator
MEKDAIEKYFNEVDLLPFTPETIINKEKLIEELDQTRKRGVSIDNKEFAQYMGISAPIRGSMSKLEGAINIRLDLDDRAEGKIEEFAGPLLRTAYEISLNMGYQPVPMEM